MLFLRKYSQHILYTSGLLALSLGTEDTDSPATSGSSNSRETGASKKHAPHDSIRISATAPASTMSHDNIRTPATVVPSISHDSSRISVAVPSTVSHDSIRAPSYVASSTPSRDTLRIPATAAPSTLSHDNIRVPVTSSPTMVSPFPVIGNKYALPRSILNDKSPRTKPNMYSSGHKTKALYETMKATTKGHKVTFAQPCTSSRSTLPPVAASKLPSAHSKTDKKLPRSHSEGVYKVTGRTQFPPVPESESNRPSFLNRRLSWPIQITANQIQLLEHEANNPDMASPRHPVNDTVLSTLADISLQNSKRPAIESDDIDTMDPSQKLDNVPKKRLRRFKSVARDVLRKLLQNRIPLMDALDEEDDEYSDRNSQTSSEDTEFTDLLNCRYLRIPPHILRRSSPW